MAITTFIYPPAQTSLIGGATEAEQLVQTAILQDIETNTASLTGIATETTLAALNAKVTTVNTGAVVVSSSALPTGASTEATLAALSAKVTTVNTGAVVVSSSALPTGAATDTLQGALTETAPASDTASSGLNGRLQRIAQRLTSLIALLPASLGAKTSAASLSIVPASDASFTVAQIKSATATLSNVASSATSVSLLASNTNRKSATIFNDSTAVLYVKFGATASTTSYTVQVAAGGYFEAPAPCYTGAIDGIWASANGNARITELT